MKIPILTDLLNFIASNLDSSIIWHKEAAFIIAFVLIMLPIYGVIYNKRRIISRFNKIERYFKEIKKRR